MHVVIAGGQCWDGRAAVGSSIETCKCGGTLRTLTRQTAVYTPHSTTTHTTLPAEARRPLCVSSAHPNGGGTATAPFGLPLCPLCPVLPQPRMTGHRLTWRPSFYSASCALGVRRGMPRSLCSTCAALPSSTLSACRYREIPAAERCGRTVAMVATKANDDAVC